MVQNGIRMDGITALARGLAKCPNIEYIDLQDNAFIVDGELTGVEAWAEALPSWPNLHTLNLSDCVLSAEGEVPEVINALSLGSNPKIHTLQLQNNNLETRTFEVLAGAVSKGIQNLKILELQWNDIEEDDEHIGNISLTLKQRGGKLFASDEDEEEEEKEKEDEEKKEGGEEDVEEEVIKVDEKPIGQKQPDSADALADLFSKVTIQP
jgi:Ran GTPase-activating protein 1